MICKDCKRENQMSFSGQAITESECKICGATIVNPTTAVNLVCGECSVERGLCEQCGRKIEEQRTV